MVNVWAADITPNEESVSPTEPPKTEQSSALEENVEPEDAGMTEPAEEDNDSNEDELTQLFSSLLTN